MNRHIIQIYAYKKGEDKELEMLFTLPNKPSKKALENFLTTLQQQKLFKGLVIYAYKVKSYADFMKAI